MSRRGNYKFDDRDPVPVWALYALVLIVFGAFIYLTLNYP